jgi:3-dehydroquinate dehydratase type I
MLCVPILSRNTEEALAKMTLAGPLADMLELRLDIMESFDLETMVQSSSKPVLVTYRSKREGGHGSAGYATRLSYLLKAVQVGADMVDVEYTLPLESRKEILQRRGRSQIILSKHLSNRTPSIKELTILFEKMVASGADVVKIVTRATKPQDNLTVLRLIPLAQTLGVEIIAFCMGPVGRLSRVAGAILGGYLTFACLEKGDESADGQLPVKEMKRILAGIRA